MRTPDVRARAPVLIPVTLFVVVAVIQGLLTVYLYQRATASVEQILAARIKDATSTVTHDVEREIATTPAGDLAHILTQASRTYHLEQAMVVDPLGILIADASGDQPGHRVSGLTLSLTYLHTADSTDSMVIGKPLSADVPTVMVYSPLHRDGHPWAVLCIELADPLPGVSEHLHLPFYIAAAIGIAMAALLVIMLLVALRAIDASRRRIQQIQGLAHAGTLAAAIAHDIKNPLGLILSSTQLLAGSSRIGAHERDTLRQIEEEVRRADDELNGYLDLVREMPLKLAPVDLAALAHGGIDLLRTKAEHHHISLTLAAPIPVLVMGDRRRLHQVLVNLVLNAIEALSEQGGMVRVTVAKEAHAALVQVADDGPGISAAISKRLFEPFATTKAQGTGLGLSMARRACERHGGTLTLESSVNGASFLMRLPLLEEPVTCAS